MPVLSVVIPVFNESAVILQFHKRLQCVLHAQLVDFEIIYVDDGSIDSTPAILRALSSAEDQTHLIRLSRNFGKEAALSAGLQASAGACVVVIDADLQDPPELIGAMMDAWRAGNDVVNMRRRSRAGETWLRKTGASWFYRILSSLSSTHIPTDVGDFRLLSRRVVDALNSLPERNRYMKGLFAWVGYTQVTIEYDRDSRAAGSAKYGFGRLFALALEGITSFSTVPLRLALFTGLIAALSAFGLTLFYVAKTIFLGDQVAGFPTVIVAILSFGGLNLLGLGILGEYMGRVVLEVKQRPLYLIAESTKPVQLLSCSGECSLHAPNSQSQNANEFCKQRI